MSMTNRCCGTCVHWGVAGDASWGKHGKSSRVCTAKIPGRHRTSTGPQEGRDCDAYADDEDAAKRREEAVRQDERARVLREVRTST